MNAVELAIQQAAVAHWGHPSWRASGDTPTYFMNDSRTVFCGYIPNSFGLWVWHWFQPDESGQNTRCVIRGVDHLKELLSDLRRPPC